MGGALRSRSGSSGIGNTLKRCDSYQENFNLYRDHDYLDLKVQMRKLLHAGWYDHN